VDSNLIEFKRNGYCHVRPHKTIPALKNNLYIYRRRGGRIVSVLCRNEADLVGDLSAGDLSNAPFASQPLLHPDSSLPFPRETARGTAFGIRVAHRGWAPLALIITTRGGTRSLSWDNALSSTEDSRLDSFLFFFSNRHENRENYLDE